MTLEIRLAAEHLVHAENHGGQGQGALRREGEVLQRRDQAVHTRVMVFIGDQGVVRRVDATEVAGRKREDGVQEHGTGQREMRYRDGEVVFGVVQVQLSKLVNSRFN